MSSGIGGRRSPERRRAGGVRNSGGSDTKKKALENEAISLCADFDYTKFSNIEDRLEKLLDLEDKFLKTYSGSGQLTKLADKIDYIIQNKLEESLHNYTFAYNRDISPIRGWARSYSKDGKIFDSQNTTLKKYLDVYIRLHKLKGKIEKSNRNLSGLDNAINQLKENKINKLLNSRLENTNKYFKSPSKREYKQWTGRNRAALHTYPKWAYKSLLGNDIAYEKVQRRLDRFTEFKQQLKQMKEAILKDKIDSENPLIQELDEHIQKCDDFAKRHLQAYFEDSKQSHDAIDDSWTFRKDNAKNTLETHVKDIKLRYCSYFNYDAKDDNALTTLMVAQDVRDLGSLRKECDAIFDSGKRYDAQATDIQELFRRRIFDYIKISVEALQQKESFSDFEARMSPEKVTNKDYENDLKAQFKRIASEDTVLKDLLGKFQEYSLQLFSDALSSFKDEEPFPRSKLNKLTSALGLSGIQFENDTLIFSRHNSEIFAELTLKSVFGREFKDESSLSVDFMKYFLSDKETKNTLRVTPDNSALEKHVEKPLLVDELEPDKGKFKDSFKDSFGLRLDALKRSDAFSFEKKLSDNYKWVKEKPEIRGYFHPDALVKYEMKLMMAEKLKAKNAELSFYDALERVDLAFRGSSPRGASPPTPPEFQEVKSSVLEKLPLGFAQAAELRRDLEASTSYLDMERIFDSKYTQSELVSYDSVSIEHVLGIGRAKFNDALDNVGVFVNELLKNQSELLALQNRSRLVDEVQNKLISDSGIKTDEYPMASDFCRRYALIVIDAMCDSIEAASASHDDYGEFTGRLLTEKDKKKLWQNIEAKFAAPYQSADIAIRDQVSVKELRHADGGASEEELDVELSQQPLENKVFEFLESLREVELYNVLITAVSQLDLDNLDFSILGSYPNKDQVLDHIGENRDPQVEGGDIQTFTLKELQDVIYELLRNSGGVSPDEFNVLKPILDAFFDKHRLLHAVKTDKETARPGDALSASDISSIPEIRKKIALLNKQYLQEKNPLEKQKLESMMSQLKSIEAKQTDLKIEDPTMRLNEIQRLCDKALPIINRYRVLSTENRFRLVNLSGGRSERGRRSPQPGRPRLDNSPRYKMIIQNKLNEHFKLTRHYLNKLSVLYHNAVGKEDHDFDRMIENLNYNGYRSERELKDRLKDGLKEIDGKLTVISKSISSKELKHDLESTFVNLKKMFNQRPEVLNLQNNLKYFMPEAELKLIADELSILEDTLEENISYIELERIKLQSELQAEVRSKRWGKAGYSRTKKHVDSMLEKSIIAFKRSMDIFWESMQQQFDEDGIGTLLALDCVSQVRSSLKKNPHIHKFEVLNKLVECCNPNSETSAQKKALAELKNKLGGGGLYDIKLDQLKTFLNSSKKDKYTNGGWLGKMIMEYKDLIKSDESEDPVNEYLKSCYIDYIQLPYLLSELSNAEKLKVKNDLIKKRMKGLHYLQSCVEKISEGALPERITKRARIMAHDSKFRQEAAEEKRKLELEEKIEWAWDKLGDNLTKLYAFSDLPDGSNITLDQYKQQLCYFGFSNTTQFRDIVEKLIFKKPGPNTLYRSRMDLKAILKDQLKVNFKLYFAHSDLDKIVDQWLDDFGDRVDWERKRSLEVEQKKAFRQIMNTTGSDVITLKDIEETQPEGRSRSSRPRRSRVTTNIDVDQSHRSPEKQRLFYFSFSQTSDFSDAMHDALLGSNVTFEELKSMQGELSGDLKAVLQNTLRPIFKTYFEYELEDLDAIIDKWFVDFGDQIVSSFKEQAASRLAMLICSQPDRYLDAHVVEEHKGPDLGEPDYYSVVELIKDYLNQYNSHSFREKISFSDGTSYSLKNDNFIDLFKKPLSDIPKGVQASGRSRVSRYEGRPLNEFRVGDRTLKQLPGDSSDSDEEELDRSLMLPSTGRGQRSNRLRGKPVSLSLLTSPSSYSDSDSDSDSESSDEDSD